VTQTGVGEVELKVKPIGEDSEIALNSQFMLDVLGNLETSEVTLKLGEKTNPAVFQASGKEDYIHIIMPLKI
jgi:DNA polymerase-3 subunit beta